MKLVRLLLAVVAVGSMAGLAYVAQKIDAAGPDQVTAATAFVDSLDAEQKKTALFNFDSDERFRWYFTPQQKDRASTRKGIALEKLSPEQKKKALAILKAGTSSYGDQEAQKIMGLENVLKEAEKMGANVRNPQWYFLTVFGTPAKSGSWGWRFEGHHLSINFTLNGEKVVAATPFFMGANPAKDPKTNTGVVSPSQELAIKLYESLDAEQKKVATHEKAFPEPGEATKNPTVGTPVGLAAAKLTADQKGVLVSLLEHYTGRNPRDIADREMKTIREAGIDNVHFAYNGSTKDGEKKSYRVQGPTFVIEFLNEQADGYGRPANHIHSAMRLLKGDFGIR